MLKKACFWGILRCNLANYFSNLYTLDARWKDIVTASVSNSYIVCRPTSLNSSYKSRILNCRIANASITATKPTAQTTISVLGSLADENGDRPSWASSGGCIR